MADFGAALLLFFAFFLTSAGLAARAPSAAIVARDEAYWTGGMAPRWIGRASASREEKITRITP